MAGWYSLFCCRALVMVPGMVGEDEMIDPQKAHLRTQRAWTMISVLVCSIILIVLLCYYGLQRDPFTVRKPKDHIALNTLELIDIDTKNMIEPEVNKRLTLIHIWGSYCKQCQEDHPHIMTIAKEQTVGIIGAVYQDSQSDSKGFLKEYGNPYDSQAMLSSVQAVKLAVTQVPETIIINQGGQILFRQVGQLSEANLSFIRTLAAND